MTAKDITALQSLWSKRKVRRHQCSKYIGHDSRLNDVEGDLEQDDECKRRVKLFYTAILLQALKDLEDPDRIVVNEVCAWFENQTRQGLPKYISFADVILGADLSSNRVKMVTKKVREIRYN